jgi:hypothetical protein
LAPCFARFALLGGHHCFSAAVLVPLKTAIYQSSMKTHSRRPVCPREVLPANAYALANLMSVFVAHGFDFRGYDIVGLESEDFPISAIPDHGIPNPTRLLEVIGN